MEYFQAHNPTAERMTEGANEAEWIVTLTTRADHQNKCVPPSTHLPHPSSTVPSPVLRHVLLIPSQIL